MTINRRTELFSKSFVPSAISLWNTLSDDVKQIDTFSQFKSHLRTTIFKQTSPPSYYHFGERKYCVFHARLRNNCSNLNFDLFRNHLKNHSYCECGYEIEDAEHYLLQCPIFVDSRLTLFHDTRSLHPLNLNILLFGSPDLCDDDNIKLFSAVHKYIKSTKRFN